MDLELYQVLADGVDAGAYLPKKMVSNLPSLPEGASEENIRFREECSRTLELYRQKLQIYEEREKAASQLSDATTVVGEVNTKIAKFNTDLADEYEQYKP